MNYEDMSYEEKILLFETFDKIEYIDEYNGSIELSKWNNETLDKFFELKKINVNDPDFFHPGGKQFVIRERNRLLNILLERITNKNENCCSYFTIAKKKIKHSKTYQ